MDKQKIPLSPLTEALISLYERASAPPPNGVEKITVSRTVSAAAFIVERIRNAIEFRDESLLRRAAIERILKRKIILSDGGDHIAKQLLRELIWAKYLQNNATPESMTQRIQTVIEKYLLLRRQLLAQATTQKQNALSTWILEVASCEIEETLAVTVKRDALLNYMYQTLRTSIRIKGADEVMENVQVYLAVSKALLKSDRPLLRYQLLKLLVPEFDGLTKDDLPAIILRFGSLINEIDRYLFHPIGAKIYRYVRRQTPPYLIIKNLCNKNEKTLKAIFSQEQTFRSEVWFVCSERYRETGQRLRRLAVRSIVYIFLTKMVFALVVEVPLDQALHGEVAKIPLIINTTFPVLLMALIALINTPPGERNTERIFARIREILIHMPKETDHKVQFSLSQTVIRPVLTFFFTLLYGLTFIVVFGIILYILSLVQFTTASQFIFIFFLCVVTFFGYQVHQTANEYRYEEREGLFAPIFDFLLLPILHVGQWLSSEVTAGVSGIFTFIFDFFFEIPLKSFFEVLEEWFSFIRTKKEELT